MTTALATVLKKSAVLHNLATKEATRNGSSQMHVGPSDSSSSFTRKESSSKSVGNLSHEGNLGTKQFVLKLYDHTIIFTLSSTLFLGSNESASGTLPADRKRRRVIEQPPPRRFETRSTAIQQSQALLEKNVARQISKIPTRRLPDYSGVDVVDKLEAKKDLRRIELASAFTCDDFGDDEDVECNKMIMRSVRPPSAPETNILSKKRRYATWATDPNQMAADMQAYRNTVSHLQQEYRSVELEEDHWLNSFDFACGYLNSALSTCKQENSRLAAESSQLQAICEQEIGVSATRKKKTTFARDFVSELGSRRDQLEELVGVYEGLVSDLSDRAPKKCRVITSIELDEKTGLIWDANAASVEAVTKLESKEDEGATKRSLRSTSTDQHGKLTDTSKESIYHSYVAVEDQLRHSESILGDIETIWPGINLYCH